VTYIHTIASLSDGTPFKRLNQLLTYIHTIASLCHDVTAIQASHPVYKKDPLREPRSLDERHMVRAVLFAVCWCQRGRSSSEVEEVFL
jgi:hypothetical protein